MAVCQVQLSEAPQNQGRTPIYQIASEFQNLMEILHLSNQRNLGPICATSVNQGRGRSRSNCTNHVS